MLVISAVKYLNSKMYHTVLKLLNIFWLLFTVNILKFICSEIRVDRDMAGYMRYRQSSLHRVHARKATSQEDFCNSCASECNLSGVSRVRRHLGCCFLHICRSAAWLLPSLKSAFSAAWTRPQYYYSAVMDVHETRLQ